MSESRKTGRPAIISRLAAHAGSVAQKRHSIPIGSEKKQTNTATTNKGAWIAPDCERVQQRLLNLNMLVPGGNLGPLVEDEYRRIKRPLLSNAFGKTSSLVDNGNLILVTSSVPGEGKSYTAVNLALTMALERDHTVMLVDGDVVRRGLSKLFGMESRPGLIDALEDDYYTIGDAMVRTDIDRLVIVPAGRKHEYVTELLASHKMETLVNEIATRYPDRIVIFDAPPILPTPQTQVLAGLVGQVVFVVESTRTAQATVEEALELIPDEVATGLILNKSEGISGRGGYFYGHYGTYGEKG